MAKNSQSFSKFIDYISPWKPQIIVASIYSALNKLFDIAPEVLIGVAVDLVVKKQDSFIASLGFKSVTSQVVFIGLLTFIIWALESFFEYLYMLKWRSIAQDIENDLRVSAYDHAQRLDLSWHEKQSTGDITAILNDDINQLERFLNNGVNQIIQVSISTIIIGVIFFYISPMIASIAIVPVPIIFLISLFFKKQLSPKYKSIRKKVGTLNSTIVNNLIAINVIKSFLTYDIEKESLREKSVDYKEENIKAIAISSAFNPLIRMGVLAGFLGTMIIGSYMALNGTIEVGSYSVLVFLTQRFLWPFTSLSVLIDDFERTMASCRRIFNLMTTEKTKYNTNNQTIPSVLNYDIKFENLTFKYVENFDLFDNFNLTIPFGSSIGIIGDTGSGKTTLSKLLLRLYTPNKGRISIGNYNINDLNIEFLRKQIGIVHQDPSLYNMSIKDNICYGISNPSNKEINFALEQSQIKDFIDKLPQGINTIVGERGQMLSGGERQRITIARTLMRKPKIIIFDEATSSVDNITEQYIQRALFSISQGRTSIIIAHRLSTIRHCDKLYVLKHGNIVEEGDHDSLIAKENSYYSKLWKIQTGRYIEMSSG